MTNEKREEAVKLANKIIKRNPRRITITPDDKEAYGLLLGMWSWAYEAADNPPDEREQKIISKLSKKIYGK